MTEIDSATEAARLADVIAEWEALHGALTEAELERARQRLGS